MANDIYNYSVMTNTGKGFIKNEDSRAFWIGGQPANVWVATDCRESRHWVARHNGVSKTKDQAQTLVTVEVDAAKFSLLKIHSQHCYHPKPILLHPLLLLQAFELDLWF